MDYKTMNIYSPQGTKVRYMDENGHDFDKEHARNHLTKGEVYTVEKTYVGGWITYIELQEFPGKTFNSVMFEEVKGEI